MKFANQSVEQSEVIQLRMPTGKRFISAITGNNMMRSMTEWWSNILQSSHWSWVAQRKAQLGRLATTGFGRTDVSLLATRCFRCRLAWVVLVSLHFSSNCWRNRVTLSDHHTRGLTTIMSSLSSSLSSLDMKSEINTLFHFSFSFSGSVDFLKVDWRSCSFWKRNGSN